MNSPLHGITVLDLSRALAGPFCTSLLSDLGARVIKVESVGGDPARNWAPFDGTHSLYFDSANRNKRSVCIDVYSEEGMALLHRMIERADVLVENFKVGTLEAMGLDAATLRGLNPDLLVASISGFGDRGPLASAAGLDQVVQGMSGLVSVTGADAEHTYRIGVPMIDLTSGMMSALSIVAGLLGKARNVDVQRMSTSLLETGLALSAFQGQRALSFGDDPVAKGNDHPTIAPYGVFRTASASITIAIVSEKHWQALCEVIGTPELVTDERFVDQRSRLAHRAELASLIEASLETDDADAWVGRLRQVGIPCGPVSTYTEVLGSEQVEALELIQETQRADGSPLPLLRSPISVNGERPLIESAPPMLGQHTREVLRGISCADAEIDDYLARGVVAEAATDDD